jgi:hypothetical protein
VVHFASAIYTLLPATGHWLAKPLNRFPRNGSHSEEQKHGFEKREPTEPGGPLLASVFVPPRRKLLYAQDRSASGRGDASGPSQERSADFAHWYHLEAPARSRFTDEACLATHATASAKRVE